MQNTIDNKIKNKIEKSFTLVDVQGDDIQKTLFFDIGQKQILPGQFFMLRLNGCQKPISVSHYKDGRIGFTILSRGTCTQSFIDATLGEYFGLIGPLGNSFTINDANNILILGGGIGTAPLFFFANYYKKQISNIDILFGAKSISFLNYTNALTKEKNINCLYYTEDGTSNHKGFVTKELESIINKTKYDRVYLCGPEIMMKKCLDIIKNKIHNIQISMERYMKCGIGICGSCVLDNIGLRVCEDGPIFDANILLQSKEFANYHRNCEGIIEKY